MSKDQFTVEELHIEYLKAVDGCSKVFFKFQKDQNNLIELTDNLLKCLKQNDKKKQINVIDQLNEDFQEITINNKDEVVDIDETKDKINIEESKADQIILSYNFKIQQQKYIDEDLFYLSKCIYFCPNLVSLSINFLYRLGGIQEMQNFKEFFKNINQSNKLRELKLDLKYAYINQNAMLEMIMSISSIQTLQELFLSINFVTLSANDWKQVYLYFMNLKKLNTLILVNACQYNAITSDEQLIARNYHKKLLNLVNKNIDFSSCLNGAIEQNYQFYC